MVGRTKLSVRFPIFFNTDLDGKLSVLGVRGSGSTSSSAITPSRSAPSAVGYTMRARLSTFLQPGTLSLRTSTPPARSSTCSSLSRSRAGTPCFWSHDSRWWILSSWRSAFFFLIRVCCSADGFHCCFQVFCASCP